MQGSTQLEHETMAIHPTQRPDPHPTSPSRPDAPGTGTSSPHRRAASGAAPAPTSGVGSAPEAAAPSAPSPSFSGLRRTERELVFGLRAGRVEAFEVLDREYRERVRRFAWKRLRDPSEAEDVCQDVFLDIHRSIGSFEGRSSFTTWLFGIAHHQVHRRFRRRGRDAVSLETAGVHALASEHPRIEDRIDAARALDRLDRVLERNVAPRHREIFRLRYANGCATREIAQQIGRSNQSVKISLFRTRRALEAASPRIPASSAAC